MHNPKPSIVSPELRAFFVDLLDGEGVELRYPWTAFARASEWIGAAWYNWDFFDHRHLGAIIAAGRLFEDKTATPEKIAALLPVHCFAEIRQIADDAVGYAQSGKTRAERIEEVRKREEKPEGEPLGEAEAGPEESRPASPKTGPTFSKRPVKQD